MEALMFRIPRVTLRFAVVACWPALAGLAFALALPCPAPACSLCDSSFRMQTTFRQELEDAKVVLFGTIGNPQFIKRPGMPPGAGTTEFHVLRVLKDDPARGGRNQLEINKYLPVTDPAAPPLYLVFCSVADGQLNPYHGRPLKSNAVLPYLAGVMEVKSKDVGQRMLFYFKYLDNDDPVVSQDAFLEFARCGDKEISDVAKHLPAAKLRTFLQDPKTPTERLGLFAFLLGASGADKDAAGLLRKMIEHPTDRTSNALDGLLSGYIFLEPHQGWELAASILGDPKKPYLQRLAVSRSVRFYQSSKPVEYKKEILRCLNTMLRDGEVADLAIDDLRQWKMWDLTKEILAEFGRPSHDSPLVRRGIVRYALCCPRPEAGQFVAALRQRDPELVRELEEALEFEKGK
jgi:hypothetical protein